MRGRLHSHCWFSRARSAPPPPPWRRIAPGRLSELFGSLALKNDKFFAGLGIEEASAKAIAQLDKNSEAYQLAMAYLDGVNQYIENGVTPIEFI